MRLQGQIVFVVLLLAACHGAPQKLQKKETDTSKRAVETYSYPVPSKRYDENQGNVKTKVIVETIKSISPSEYSSTGYLGTSIEANTTSGKGPVSSVTFNAFEPETTKNPAVAEILSTEGAVSANKKTGYKYYTNIIKSDSQKSTDSSLQISSTNSPASIQTTSIEPTTTLFPGYQHSSHSSNFLQSPAPRETALPEKPTSIIKVANERYDNERYRLQKFVKKTAKIEPRISDSKLEDIGFNGYHYDVGSLGFESKHTSSQGGGMMGASYMRSSSPFYNFHVMLD